MTTTGEIAELTPRQAEILGWIRGYIAAEGRPPTVREIGAAFGMRSPNAVMCHLKALIRKGCLRNHVRGSGRGYIPVAAPGCCPCCGRRLAEAT